MTGARLDHGGALIDRTRPLRWQWGGRTLDGFAGDTVASALLANGIMVAGRSFKYHRPRGLLGAGLEEPNILIQLGTGAQAVPNLKATAVWLHEGLVAAPVNCWPSSEFDLMAVTGLLKRFLPAAFYYKTFKWPNWSLFEPLIRRAAGLGKAPRDADPDRYEHGYAQCDTLVIGGGRSGLSEALRLAAQGREIVIAEHEPHWGGHRRGQDADEDMAIDAIVQRLHAMPNVRMLSRTIVFGAYDHLCFGLCQQLSGTDGGDVGPRERLIKLRCKTAVMATGAIERPLLFENNDLPGIMLASAAEAYLARHAVLPGKRIGFAVNNDGGWQSMLAFARRGIKPAFILDSRQNLPGAAQAEAAEAGIPIVAGARIERARGRRRLRGIVGVDAHGAFRLSCDALLVSGGYNPVVSLHSQANGSLEWSDALAAFCPVSADSDIKAVGRAAGDGLPPVARIDVPDFEAGGSGRIWVDFQNDVTALDIALADRESFSAIEHVKRYTTLGMATDQGKTSNVNAIAVMGQLTSREPAKVGTTRFRPPYDPVTVGTFAGAMRGAQLDPPQRLPAHDFHIAAGAQMDEYGAYLRPAAYPLSGETPDAAIIRETMTVRNAVGLFDASPLGKIEVHGPDAAAFIDRCVVSTVSTLSPGRCRYTLMTAETGIVMDDGIIVRRPDGSFIFGTSSAGAQRLHAQLEQYLQCEWPDLDVALIDATDNWAVMTLAGPLARDVLARCRFNLAQSQEALPHLGYAEGEFAGEALRISRVSYSGELSYEVSTPAALAINLAEHLTQAGAEFGLAPFGIECLDILRVEKGFLHVGNETDGTTMPQDIGFATPLTRKASDFIGRRGALMQVGRGPGRKQLVGLAAVDGRKLPVGAHIRTAVGTGSDGWVTSSVDSSTLGRPHALAMVANGQARMGETIVLWDLGPDNRGRSFEARIVAPCAYDPEGTRMRL